MDLERERERERESKHLTDLFPSLALVSIGSFHNGAPVPP